MSEFSKSVTDELLSKMTLFEFKMTSHLEQIEKKLNRLEQNSVEHKVEELTRQMSECGKSAAENIVDLKIRIQSITDSLGLLQTKKISKKTKPVEVASVSIDTYDDSDELKKYFVDNYLNGVLSKEDNESVKIVNRYKSEDQNFIKNILSANKSLIESLTDNKSKISLLGQFIFDKLTDDDKDSLRAMMNN